MVEKPHEELIRMTEMVRHVETKGTIYAIAITIALIGVTLLGNAQLQVSVNQQKTYDWNLLAGGGSCLIVALLMTVTNFLNSCCAGRQICAKELV